MMNELEQTTCKRCGRKLRNPKAIELGMGATCWKKFMEEDNHKKLFSYEKEPAESKIE
jgi:hypothetical protein